MGLGLEKRLAHQAGTGWHVLALSYDFHLEYGFFSMSRRTQ